MKLFRAAGIVLLMSSWCPAQHLPETMMNWQRADTSSSYPPFSVPGKRPSDFDVCRVYETVSATYRRDRSSLTVTVAKTAAPLQAFALFGMQSGTQLFTGIIGDAFIEIDGRMLITYGPFFIEIRNTGRRRQRIEDVFITALKKVLYTWADCTKSDIPLPVLERVLGSERYLVAPSSWELHFPSTFTSVRDMIKAYPCYTAIYRKRFLRTERALYLFPVASQAERKSLVEMLKTLLEPSGSNDCDIPSISQRGETLYLVESDDGVMLCSADHSDSGCCFWLVEAAREHRRFP